MAAGAAEAAKVGYNRTNDLGYSAGLPAAITAAGHSAVPVTALDAASLAGLDALVLVNCHHQPLLGAPNPALDAAVQNGMTLVIESMCSPDRPTYINSSNLPGSPAYSTSSMAAYPEADDIEIPAGSPIRSGPGGTLTATSLDRIPAGSPGPYTMTHYYPRSALPAGASVLLTTGNPDHVGAFAWQFGNGRVIHSETQSTVLLPGSSYENHSSSFGPGMRAYFANLLAWATATTAGPTTTCASEGYTGMKLDWCRNICEKDYTGTQLKTWIRRWMDRYHDLPYCMREDEETPPQEQGAF